jgi:hypothetical protein
MGIVPHGVALETIAEVPIESIFMPINSMVWLVREPNTMVSHNLIIDQGPVMDGDIFTSVFNLSNSQLRIRKGEVVSRLVCIQGVTWRTA